MTLLGFLRNSKTKKFLLSFLSLIPIASFSICFQIPTRLQGEAYFDAYKYQRREEARSRRKQLTYKFVPSGQVAEQKSFMPHPIVVVSNRRLFFHMSLYYPHDPVQKISARNI